MTYAWGKRSLGNLATCEVTLQDVLSLALSYGVIDMTVIEGARETERQKYLFASGKSKIDGVTKFSKHQVGGNTGRKLSKAADVVPLVNGQIDWNNTLAFHIMAGVIMAAAAQLGVKIRWGGDWDGDKSNKDQSFHDLPHFELVD